MRPTLTQKKGFVTADVSYVHPCTFTGRFAHVLRGFCVTHA